MAATDDNMTLFDELDQMNAYDGVADETDFASIVRKVNDLEEIENDWLERTPEENLALLNAESEANGMSDFAYMANDGYIPDIPGMTTLTYSIPNDSNGGVYVAYETYASTYQKATEAFAHGDISVEDFEMAGERYRDQKNAYEAYSSQYGCDYLDSELSVQESVEMYSEFEYARLEQEAIDERILREGYENAEHSVPLDEIENAETDEFGIGEIANADQIGQYSLTEQAEDNAAYDAANAGSTYFRWSDDFDQQTIDSMSAYTPIGKTELPEITAEPGTDEYGKQLIARAVAIDADLEANDESYVSPFPENMQYYPAGQNPESIPGMTLVIGQIEGLDGYYAGYESYSDTYSYANEQIDLIEESGEDVAGYREEASAQYDAQRAEYDDYVSEHKGNDFLEKDDPVDSYQKYTNSSSVEQDAADLKASIFGGPFIEKLKEWVTSIVNYFEHKGESDGFTEEQAAVYNSAYWTKRAELEPDNELIQSYAKEYGDELAAYEEEHGPVDRSIAEHIDSIEAPKEAVTEASVDEDDVIMEADVSDDEFVGSVSNEYYEQLQANAQGQKSAGMTIADVRAALSYDPVEPYNPQYMMNTGQSNPYAFTVGGVDFDSNQSANDLMVMVDGDQRKFNTVDYANYRGTERVRGQRTIEDQDVSSIKPAVQSQPVAKGSRADSVKDLEDRLSANQQTESSLEYV